MRFFGILAALVLWAIPALAGDALPPVERAYADWLDATYAVSTLSSGAVPLIDGRDQTSWQILLKQRTAVLKARLDHESRLKPRGEAARRLRMMRQALANPPAEALATSAEESASRCETVGSTNLDRTALSAALYGCFERYGNQIPFEGRTIARTTALDLLQDLDSSERRKSLFDALVPLWRRINADDAPGSPYRRLIGLAADEARKNGSSRITDAARTLGIPPGEVEAWLVAVLA